MIEDSNPFIYSRPIAPDDVIDRDAEIRELLGHVVGGHYVRLYAPRKFGKTSLLRAIVGQSSQGTFSVDIRSDGPHALVGGTTGAGKSELLQAWILGMAAAHSPQRVTFLLVDYKGGSAFRDCVKLPHTVGMVTNLDARETERALASLDAPDDRHRVGGWIRRFLEGK